MSIQMKPKPLKFMQPMDKAGMAGPVKVWHDSFGLGSLWLGKARHGRLGLVWLGSERPDVVWPSAVWQASVRWGAIKQVMAGKDIFEIIFTLSSKAGSWHGK
jgi:hypothetical protein